MDELYNTILRSELEKRLKRPATDSEFINADFDSDLVNECLWQLLNQLNDKVTLLQKNTTN